MEATRGEYTPKEGASLKTQNNGKKKRGKNQQCKMVRMQPTCGEYTSKGGASLKTQNKKKEGGIKIDAMVRMEANCGENTPKHRYARR